MFHVPGQRIGIAHELVVVAGHRSTSYILQSNVTEASVGRTGPKVTFPTAGIRSRTRLADQGFRVGLSPPVLDR